MKILMVTSETVPFAKTGGLADAVSALAINLRKQGHDVRIVMPRYYKIDRNKLKAIEAPLAVAAGTIETWVKVYQAPLPGSDVPVYFIDHEACFGRDGIYGTKAEPDFHDNPYRSAVLCHGAFQVCRMLGWYPDIMHAHDWFCCLVPVLLKHVCRNGYFAHTASVLTIHNLGYQGWYSKDSFPALGVNWNLYHGAGFERNGSINLLQAGISCADMITTVSPTYAGEMQSLEGGFGLDGLLRVRSDVIRGVLNGCDLETWNPETDKNIIENYNKKRLSGKKKCKKQLQKQLGLRVSDDVLLVGMVSRLTWQKGVSIILEKLSEIMNQDIQLIILGTGDGYIESQFKQIEHTYPHRAVFYCGYNEALSHQVYAGVDVLLMPSLFEPCGISQLIAQRYGTLPLVREVGGLKDTVHPYNEYQHTGDGFSFKHFTGNDLLNVLKYAMYIYYYKKPEWKLLMKNAMSCDVSWDNSAKKYIELFEEISK